MTHLISKVWVCRHCHSSMIVKLYKNKSEERDVECLDCGMASIPVMLRYDYELKEWWFCS